MATLRIRIASLVAVAALVSSVAVVVPETVVNAENNPNISLAVSMPAETLYGTPTPVTLTARNAGGTDGHNLSFNEELPPGAALISANPAPTRAFTDASGRLVLIWRNVADLRAGASQSISYSFLASVPEFRLASVISDDAGAYVNLEARVVPEFDQASGYASGHFDGFATASGSTLLTPFRVTQPDSSAAAQMLRGVHVHKSVYTLEVDNNRVLPSAGLALEDYLPAGLEFLGCRAEDNTAAGVEEYAGSERLDTSFPTFTNPCVVPSTVETVHLDPDGTGPLPLGVYTDVVWSATDLGALADQVAGGTFSIDFAVAVPLRENALFPNGTATDGVQGSNLDNNTGALTTDEQVLTDRAVATGTTGGVTTNVGANRTVTAEDLAAHSSVDVGTIRPGAISTWTTSVQTSEYARTTGSIAMTDLVPDGLCVIAPGSPCAASGVSPAPAAASVSGSAPTTVVWNLAPLPANATTTVAMRTQTSTVYAGSQPVSTSAGWLNTVSVTATASVIVDRSAATNNVGVVGASFAAQVGDPVARPGRRAASAVTAASDVTSVDPNFGSGGTGSIGDIVWLDLNGNGAYDAGEPGIPAVDVTLDWAGIDGTLGTGDDATATVSTDASGHFLFGSLPAGDYKVSIDPADLPGHVVPTHDHDGGADSTSTLRLATGASDLDQDFGYRGTASVGNRVWIDMNGNRRQDDHEPPYAGLTVRVTAAGHDGALGTADDIAVERVTDARGTYVATGLPAGDVRVAYDAADLAKGDAPSSDLDGGNATSTVRSLVDGAAPRNVDFGVRGTGSLVGVVWHDTDADGTRGPGEGGLGGVAVTAVWDGPTGSFEIKAATRPDGTWSMQHLPAGSYTVTVTQSTVSPDLVASTPPTSVVEVRAGRKTKVRNGETPGASIGDLVWLDTHNQGVHDSDESGIANVGMALQDKAYRTIASTTTDASGRYLFRDLAPGTYRVVVDTNTLPPGFQQYADPDSTIDAQSMVTVGAGESDLAQNFSFAGGDAELPRTGANPIAVLILGLALVGAGAVLGLAARRRYKIRAS